MLVFKIAQFFWKWPKKVATLVLNEKRTFFKIAQWLQKFWITFLRKFVIKTFQKLPNLVTLLRSRVNAFWRESQAVAVAAAAEAAAAQTQILKTWQRHVADVDNRKPRQHRLLDIDRSLTQPIGLCIQC